MIVDKVGAPLTALDDALDVLARADIELPIRSTRMWVDLVRRLVQEIEWRSE